MAKYYLDDNGNVTTQNRNQRKKGKRYILGSNGGIIEVESLGGEEDIAPVRETAKKEEKEDDSKLDFFQKGLFDDGYDAGDITKTILGTAGDIGLGFVKGVAKIGEGAGKAIATGVAGVADKIGQDEYAARVRKNLKESAIDNLTEGASDYLDDRSVLGRTSKSIVEGVGQVGGILATGGMGAAAGLGTAGVTALTTGVTGVSSFGHGVGEAYKGGAEEGEAELYGLIAGAADAGTELLFGGLGKAVKAKGLSTGILNIDDALAKKVSSLFSNQIAKNITEYGIKSSAEGFEEFLAGVVQAAGKYFTYMSDEEFEKILEDENLLEQVVVGAVTSGIAQAPSLVQSTQQGRDFVTGRTENEEAVISKEVEKRIEEAKAEGKTLSKKEEAAIAEQVEKDMEKGRISTDTIEEVLGGEAYERYKKVSDMEDSLTKEEETAREEFNTLNRMKKGDMTGEQTDRLEELRTKLTDISSRREKMTQDHVKDNLKKNLSDEVSFRVKDDRLIESYNEKARRSQAFEADLEAYSPEQRKVVEKAVKSGILNNTNRTHEFVDIVSRISADKGVLFDFTNNMRLKESGFAVEGATVNGYITKDGIAINMDSPKAWQSTVGHEITHVLEGTEVYTELQSALFEYAKAKNDYQGRYDTLNKLYKGKNVEAELTADLVGDYLFTDEAFVNSLSTKHRNVFQKIYDEIKYLAKIVTAGSKEARQLEKVKRAFDKAYRAKKSTIQGDGVAYSFGVTQDDINRYVDAAYNKENTEDYKKYAEVSDRLQEDVADEIDLSGYSHALRDNDIRHIRNSHGEKTAEKYPVTKEDIKNIPWIVEHYDKVVVVKRNDGRVGVVYVKTAENGLVYYLEQATETYGNEPLLINKQMIKTGIDDIPDLPGLAEAITKKQSEAEFLDDLKKAPEVYVQDVYQSHSKDSISENSEKSSGDVKKSLSEEQQAYFKDSVVRDENGNLKVMYHGTSQGGHTMFDPYGKARYGLFGAGSYFTDSKVIAESYTKKGKGDQPQVYETYLNITNPIDMDAPAVPAEWKRAMPDVDFPKSGTNEDFYRVMEEYFEGNEYPRWEAAETAMEVIEGMGYDGITHIGGGRVNADGERHQVYIAFRPEQIKNIDNAKPTSDPDIRYSLSESKQESDTYSRIFDMQIEVNKLRETIKEFEKSESFKVAMDNLSKAMDGGDLDGAIKEYIKWKNNSGYDSLISRRDALQAELDNLRKEYSDNIANEAIERERASIEKSGLSEADYFRKQAVKKFGHTPYFYDAGYITPNGKMLNFSGEKGKHFSTRGQDHRAIGTIYAESEGTDALNRFVRDGNIRIIAESPGIDVSTVAEPTKEQYATIREFVSEYANKEFFNVDFTDESGKVIGSLTYNNRINSARVINDIKHFFETGEIRQPSEFEGFHYSLSEGGEGRAPKRYGNFATPASDLRLEATPVREDIAPAQETAQEAPVKETAATAQADEYAPISEAEANALQEESLASLGDVDAPPEADTPYYGESEDMAPDDPFENRDIKEVGNRKVKAYMYENPEVKPFFQDEAKIMLGELERTIKGEKIYTEGDFGGYGGDSYYRWTGTKRQTSEDIAYLLDEHGYTYAEIEKGLKAIIEDDGKENNAVSKRIEFLLNDRLLKGYQDDTYGLAIPPNQAYMNLLNEKQITEYNEEAQKRLFGTADQFAPHTEDIAPVRETVAPPMADDIAPVKEFEAVTPRRTPKKKTANRMRRVDVPLEHQKIAEILDEEPTAGNRKSRAWAKFRANFLDKGSVFEDLALKTKNRELMGKWNYMLYSEARAQRLIGNGADGVKPLNTIIEEVGETGKNKQFYEYLYHMHNIDRMSLAERYEDVPNKAVFGDSVTADVSREAVKTLARENPEFRQYAQDVYEYNSYLRSLLVEGGVISQETADLWAEMYPHYVPIRRAGDTGLNVNVPLDTGRTSVNGPVKKATGGNSDILPLFDTMALRTIQTYRAIAKNSFGVELKNTLGTTVSNEQTSVDDVIDSIDTQDSLLQKGQYGRNPTFTVFENGEKVTYEITEDMYDAMKPMSEGLADTFRPFNAISNFHRGVLTEYNPVFMLTNAIKDIQDMFINSQHPLKTYAKIPEAFAQLTRKGYWYNEYMGNGGDQNSYFDNETNTFKTENKGIARILDIPPLSTISKLNNYIEMIPRLAEYIASREAGRSVEVSMLDAARVTTNFRAAGDISKFFNRNGATFLTASISGAMQQVRNVREAKANGAKGWASLAVKFALAGLPALILNHLVWDDDEEYEELSDYVKQNYYIVGKTDEGKFIRIPKGRTIAAIQTAIDQTVELATGHDELDYRDFLGRVLSNLANLAPNNPIEDNILAPIIDVYNNETWYGGDLVPQRLQDLPAAEQYDESTDAFSKWLGNTKLGKKLGISPVKANYLLDQYSGGVGDVVLPMMTPEAESGDNSFWGNVFAPLKSKFSTDGVMNNQNVSDFYDTKDDLTTEAKKSAATDRDILMSKYMNSMNSDISNLYAEKRKMQNSNLPDDEKYARVREIQGKIVDATREALETYEDITFENDYREGGEYARIGDRVFKKDDDGEWVKLSDEQLEKYEVTRAAGDASYASNVENHYRWYVPDEDSTAEEGWRKITDKQLKKQRDVQAALGISPEDYWSNKEEYDYAYEYPEKYAVAKAVGGYQSYKSYSKALNDIEANKDENDKSISGSRKEKVISYIDGLNADYGEKIILFKSEYNADDTYNYEIIDYLNSREDISYLEMVTILRELGFTVSKDGNITW